jgi:hypothetical protein
VALLLTPHASRAESSRRVEVVVAAAPEADAQLTPVLLELLSRLPVELTLTHAESIDVAQVVTPPQSEPTPALARVFIEGRGRDAAIVYLVDATWERVLVRRLPLERGLDDEVAREQLAHIVESAVATLVAGGVIGVSRAEATAQLGVTTELPQPVEPVPPRSPPSRPPPPPPSATYTKPPSRAPDRAIEARTSVGWVLSPWTPQTLAQGPELRVGVDARRGRFTWGGALSGRYSLSREVRSNVVGMRIEGAGLRAMARARYSLESSFAVLAAGGFGFDRETFRPTPGESPFVSLEAGGARTAGLLATSLGMEVRVAGPLWLGAEAGVELDLAPDDYVVRSGSGFVAIAEPLQLRPTFSTLLTLAP